MWFSLPVSRSCVFEEPHHKSMGGEGSWPWQSSGFLFARTRQGADSRCYCRCCGDVTWSYQVSQYKIMKDWQTLGVTTSWELCSTLLWCFIKAQVYSIAHALQDGHSIEVKFCIYFHIIELKFCPTDNYYLLSFISTLKNEMRWHLLLTKSIASVLVAIL